MKRLNKEEYKSCIDWGESLLDDLSILPRRCQAALLGGALIPDNGISEMVGVRGNLDYSECKSPIEKIFSVCYEIMIYSIGFPECELIYLHPQEEITVAGKKYYADFLIDTERVGGIKHDNPLRLIIECDGHEFHEKTKEQVIQRNERDLALKMAGYDILHFSGSEIYRNPYECAIQTIEYALLKIGNYEVE